MMLLIIERVRERVKRERLNSLPRRRVLNEKVFYKGEAPVLIEDGGFNPGLLTSGISMANYTTISYFL
jgi:hypothetical protein